MFGKAPCEACRVTWNLGTNSTFALGQSKTKEELNRGSFKHGINLTNT